MNLPISLTLLRIFFVPLVVVLLLTTGHNMDLWAVGVFLLAATTEIYTLSDTLSLHDALPITPQLRADLKGA